MVRPTDEKMWLAFNTTYALLRVFTYAPVCYACLSRQLRLMIHQVDNYNIRLKKLSSSHSHEGMLYTTRKVVNTCKPKQPFCLFSTNLWILTATCYAPPTYPWLQGFQWKSNNQFGELFFQGSFKQRSMARVGANQLLLNLQLLKCFNKLATKRLVVKNMHL